MPKPTLHLTATTPGMRLDHFMLAHLTDISRSAAQKLIRGGHVRVDGAARKAGFKFKGGERVEITLPAVAEATLSAENIPLDIVYEDAHLAVICKAAGMVTQPGAGHRSGTLVNALLWRYPELHAMREDETARDRLGIVHRLDRGTSGLMVVARDAITLKALMAQFQARTVEKAYLALLENRPSSDAGLIDAPIARDPKQRKRMAVRRDGRQSQTEFSVLDDDFQGGRALVELRLLTGRTHQIRVHMAFIGCPVVGDSVYGFRKQRLKLKRQFLHACRLAFDHPASGVRLTFESDLPANLRNVMDKLR